MWEQDANPTGALKVYQDVARATVGKCTMFDSLEMAQSVFVQWRLGQDLDCSIKDMESPASTSEQLLEQCLYCVGMLVLIPLGAAAHVLDLCSVVS